MPLPELPNNFQTHKCWEFQERRASGVFVTSLSGALLFRIEPPFTLWVWDKKASREVPIDVRDLPLWDSVKQA